jgi:hypothetical protein
VRIRTTQDGRTPGFHSADTVESLALEVERRYVAATGDSASPGTLGVQVEGACIVFTGAFA